jgi:hypothetical protein
MNVIKAGVAIEIRTGYTEIRVEYSCQLQVLGIQGVLATHSIRQFPLHFPIRASPCAITFQLDSTT